MISAEHTKELVNKGLNIVHELRCWCTLADPLGAGLVIADMAEILEEQQKLIQALQALQPKGK